MNLLLATNPMPTAAEVAPVGEQAKAHALNVGRVAIPAVVESASATDTFARNYALHRIALNNTMGHALYRQHSSK